MEDKMKTFKQHKCIPKIDKETGIYRYPKDKTKPSGYADSKDIPPEYWSKIKFIVDSEQSKDQLLKALEYIHYLGEIDSDLMAVNILMHMYLFPGSVEVRPDYNFDVGSERK